MACFGGGGLGMQLWLLAAEPREEAGGVVGDDGIDVSVGELIPCSCIVAGVREQCTVLSSSE